MKNKVLFKVIFLSFLFCASALIAGAQTLHVVLVGDLYDINPKKNERGGYAKLATIVNYYRNQGKTLFVHAGDAFSPSLISSITKGSHVVRLLNAEFLDYFVPGNHEFDFGTETAIENFSKAKFKILAGNIEYTPPPTPLPNILKTKAKNKKNKTIGEVTLKISGDEPEKIAHNYTLPIPNTLKTDIIEFEGIKVGIYGLLTTRTASLNPNSGLKILPLIVSAETFYKQLKNNGADFVIALVQTDMKEDISIVNSGFADTVLSGDDHINLTFNNGKVTWMESGEDAQHVAVLSVDFSRNNEGKLSWEQSIRTIDTKDVPENQAIKEIVDEYNTLLDEEFGKEIGKTTVDLNSERVVVRSSESNMGNLIADALREKLNTDIAITNGGGIRGNKIYPAGTVLTRKDILAELPFGNVGTAIRLNGRQIAESLENGVSAVEDGAGRFPQVSGISFDWSISSPKGARVKNIKIMGAPIDPNKIYTVATNNYLMGGGDNYTVFKAGEVIINASAAELIATTVMEYIEKKKEIAPKIEMRINRLN